MKVKTILYLLVAITTLSGCQNANSYAALLSKEKDLISGFIERNQLNILPTEPDTSYVWGEKDYYKVSGYDNLYFHLIKRGPSYRIYGNDTIEDAYITSSETCVMRYKKFTLDELSDTTSYWSTLDSPYPVEFQYLTDLTNAPTAWHEAVRLMRYSESECEIICPSKLGFTEDGSTVTPYGYILKMKVKR